MDGHYHQLPPAGTFYTHALPTMSPEAFAPRLQPLQTMSSETLSSYSDYEQVSRPIVTGQGGARSRRRQSAGAENVKHRRTRSGCYTCRSRRVKCDEAHPICDRCRKGNRECAYPESGGANKSSRSQSKSSVPESASNSSTEEDDQDEKKRLSSILDEDTEATNNMLAQSSLTGLSPLGETSSRELSDTPSLIPDQGTSSPTEGSILLPHGQLRQSSSTTASKRPTRRPGVRSERWAELPKDVKFFLNYHRTQLSHYHYAFNHDAGDFLKTTFLEIAIRNDPLLYAVVGFAAYHYTLTTPNGKIQDFLGYYNQSVSQLRLYLAENQKHTVATLLTILQLATFEEFLGDWVNLLGHQKAAYEILTELHTPQTIMQDETRRKILSWYTRFDLYAGLLSGYETVLGREWFAAAHDFYRQQVLDKPGDTGAVFEEIFAFARLLGTDTALLLAQNAKGQVNHEDFLVQYGNLNERFAQADRLIQAMVKTTDKYVTDFSGAPPRDPDDIVDPYNDHFLYANELFTMNYVLVDYWAIYLMFKYQLSIAERTLPSEELVKVSLKMCQMFEALEYCPSSPPGAMLGAQASLGIASLFLPQDSRHSYWCRKKLAVVESAGYIYPATFRARMTDLWKTDVMRWWLPNDEGCPPLVQSIRQFIEDRTMTPRAPASENLPNTEGLSSSVEYEDVGARGDRGTGTDSESAADPNTAVTLAYESSPDYSWS
ncbi:hypothetical protein LTR66_003293 [Elasticomyces elasticus]|nr:hypothetical protein LTR66_003293 [Elasticomyces elasticus]